MGMNAARIMAPSTQGKRVRDGAIRPVAAPTASDARAPRIRRASFIPSENHCRFSQGVTWKADSQPTVEQRANQHPQYKPGNQCENRLFHKPALSYSLSC
jgi:hypothetical protein